MTDLTDRQKTEILNDLAQLSEVERRKKTVEINELDVANWKAAMPRMSQALANECRLLIIHVSEQTDLIKKIIAAIESNDSVKIDTAKSNFAVWHSITKKEFPVERVIAFADYFDFEWDNDNWDI